MINNSKIEEFIAQAHRFGAEKLMLCSSGNLSWKVGDKILVSGTGSWVPTLKKENVSICNLQSGKPINDIRPSMESTFHIGIMKEREDVNVVLHFQSEYATTVACMENMPVDFNVTAEIPCHIGSEIPIIPYFRPGSPELAKAVIEQMKDHNFVILSKHGQVVCGKNFEEVYERAMFFEMACKIIVHSNCKYKTLNDAEIKDLEKYVTGKKS